MEVGGTFFKKESFTIPGEIADFELIVDGSLIGSRTSESDERWEVELDSLGDDSFDALLDWKVPKTNRTLRHTLESEIIKRFKDSVGWEKYDPFAALED